MDKQNSAIAESSTQSIQEVCYNGVNSSMNG